MKKIAPILVSFALLLPVAACAAPPADGGGEGRTETEISLWTYPVGEWGNANSVAPLINAFRRVHPEISIKIKIVDYATGDSEVEKAIAEGTPPDLILEGPERLVANWGARDLMVSLNDLWDSEATDGVYENVEKACRKDETYYIYPLCMTTHCMAINRDLFEEANAWQYIDEEHHTWTTEGFQRAVAAIDAYNEANGLKRDVAAVYCSGQGGDQGTRALVNNLYGGTFADKTGYTVDSEENIRALRLLRDMKGIRFDAEMNGAEEQNAFCKGELAMAFCWNVAAEVNQSIAHPDFASSIFPMAFPAEEGKDPSLQGGIWGFGVFQSGDKARVSAAKEFIRFLGEEDYTRAVTTSSYLPVRKLARDPYENDALMNEYDIFSQYLGEYYQITPGWADARTAWWTLLQAVGEGADIAQAIKNFPQKQP